MMDMGLPTYRSLKNFKVLCAVLMAGTIALTGCGSKSDKAEETAATPRPEREERVERDREDRPQEQTTEGTGPISETIRRTGDSIWTSDYNKCTREYEIDAATVADYSTLTDINSYAGFRHFSVDEKAFVYPKTIYNEVANEDYANRNHNTVEYHDFRGSDGSLLSVSYILWNAGSQPTIERLLEVAIEDMTEQYGIVPDTMETEGDRLYWTFESAETISSGLIFARGLRTDSMVISCPAPTDEQDRAVKEFYMQMMFNMWHRNPSGGQCVGWSSFNQSEAE